MIYKRPTNERNNLEMTDDEILEDIFIAAKEVFCDGIYIATENHDCGWDFLSFEYLEVWSDLKDKTIGDGLGYELNDGRYDYTEENGKYLIDVLKENGWKFAFENSGIEW